MNKLLAFTVPIGLLLVACGPHQPIPKDCVVVTIERDKCPSPPGGIMINRNGHAVTPINYCLPQGEVIIQFTVKPPNGPLGSVTTKPKIEDDPAHDWLNGTNDPDANSFALDATGAPPGEYDYYVYFADGYCIDPRITI